MTVIKVLPHSLREKIAAGEVIERPVSVVKELIENSIDAGANRITVDIQDGGKALIRVTDDGSGIYADDMPLAAERHATSKIAEEADLYAVDSLGFRGEALASIRAVSRLRIISRRHDSDEGAELLAQGDEPVEITPIGCPPGTSITVSDIFYNLPARLKFLKTSNTEQRKIQEVMERYAMAYPEKAFVMTADGRELLNAVPAASAEDRLVDIYGRQAVDGFVEIAAENDYASISGLVSRPGFSRSNRSDQTLIINGRLVQSAVLRFALERAYRELLPAGRYPLALIRMRVDPSRLDVNVHPQKAEVRFVDERDAGALLERTVRHTLLDRRLKTLSPFTEARPDMPMGGGTLPHSHNNYNSHKPRDRQEPLNMQLMENSFTDFFGDKQAPSMKTSMMEAEVKVSVTDNDFSGFPATKPGINIIGQALQMYVVAYDDLSIILIDQHAAHERILYDRLMRADGAGSQVQVLLLPETIELRPAEMSIVEERSDILKSLGFTAEHFGKNTYRLTEVPMELAEASPAVVFRDIVSDLMEAGSSAREEQVRAS
ncbi:MAG: DNA mismatch repair endonuclease MutL, partial [bacterium]|nr:DNA mismatch repair endonuclease MutL [bacterium]